MKKNNETITVITPVYNMAKYLPMCIDSILNQTYDNFILLLVDDGSIDKSGEICDNYAQKDNRVKVIHTPNRGQDAARNIALENVETDYIAMIDSDDCVNKCFLEALMFTMKQSQADIVCPSYKNYTYDNEIDPNEDVDYLNFEYCLYNKNEAVEELCLRYRTSFVTPQKLYKTKVFEGVKYPPVGVNIDEWVIHHLILNVEKYAVLNCQLYYYRKSLEGMTRNFSEKKISGIKAVIDRIQTLKQYGYNKYVPDVSYRLHYLAIDFYQKCKVNKLDGKRLLQPYKKDLKNAFKSGVKKRKDLFSRKEMLLHWSFAISFTLFDILSKYIKA